MVESFKEVTGSCTPYSITGSLPCIRELQVGDAGPRGRAAWRALRGARGRGHRGGLGAARGRITCGRSNPARACPPPALRSPPPPQDDGFDVQTMGFGKLAAYHANNEVGARGRAARFVMQPLAPLRCLCPAAAVAS